MQLTKREIEVVKEMANDRIAKEIAKELGIALKTVEQHSWNIKRKTGLKTAAGVVYWAIRNNIIQ